MLPIKLAKSLTLIQKLQKKLNQQMIYWQIDDKLPRCAFFCCFVVVVSVVLSVSMRISPEKVSARFYADGAIGHYIPMNTHEKIKPQQQQHRMCICMCHFLLLLYSHFLFRAQIRKTKRFQAHQHTTL